MAGRQRLNSRQRKEISLFGTASTSALRSNQHSVQWGEEDTSAGVQRPGREADHSYPSSAEVKREQR